MYKLRFPPPKNGPFCARVMSKIDKTPSNSPFVCHVDHRNKYVPCACAVVYEFPFTCGHVYIGQTGRCINIRLREHSKNYSSDVYSHVAKHCRECEQETKRACHPLLDRTKVLYRHKDRNTRELYEAYAIRKTRACVSDPSVQLADCEVQYLDSRF